MLYLLFSINPVVFSQNVTIPRLPRCCGKFELSRCTNPCMRASCYNTAIGPRLCPQYCGTLCVCEGDLVYNDCTQQCVRPHRCPSLCELKQCIQQSESYDHCYHNGGSSSNASARATANASATANAQLGANASGVVV